MLPRLHELWSGPRCNVGGRYEYRSDMRSTWMEPCTATPTHRYRTPGHVDGHWSYRCERHAADLDRTVCTVEPLPGKEAAA